jgi:FixJ family two-component response regulator
MVRETPDMKVVFMSGYADAPGCEEVVRDGLPFIQKPFSTADIARLLRETIDGAPAPAGEPS